MHYRATSLEELPQATIHTEALKPGDPFFTDFSGLRGRFKEHVLYRALGVKPADFSYSYEKNRNVRKLVFLAGLRGCGKSTELYRYAQELENPGGLYCVFCNLDQDLDNPYLEYAEILIYQMERLIDKMWADGISIEADTIKSMTDWFQSRLKEINTFLGQGTVRFEPSEGAASWMRLLELLRWIRTVVFGGSLEQASQGRMAFNNRFIEFAARFNEFVAQASQQLRDLGKAQDILFILDGLEKLQTDAVRRRLILEESNRIRMVRANMLFTLPIELMTESKKIREDAEVITFPFVKVRESDGTVIEAALERFRHFVDCRVAPEVFENQSVVEEAILFSGGSPRELLRLLQHAAYQVLPGEAQINRASLLEAVEALGADARLNVAELELLKAVKRNVENGQPTPYMDGMQRLLENVTLMEYNDGNYKRVNPIVEHSSLYRSYVG